MVSPQTPYYPVLTFSLMMRWDDGTPALGGKVRQRDTRSIVLGYCGVFHGT